MTDYYNALRKDLLDLHKSMKYAAQNIGEQNIIGSHPVYQYLSKAYSIKIHNVHFEPDEMPSDKQWKEFDHLLDHYPASIMLWDDKPLYEVKEALRSRGIEM